MQKVSDSAQAPAFKPGVYYYTLLHFWGEWIHNAHNPRCLCMRVILLAYLFRVSHFISHWAKSSSALFVSFSLLRKGRFKWLLFLLVECGIWIVSACRGWFIHIFKVIWQQNHSLFSSCGWPSNVKTLPYKLYVSRVQIDHLVCSFITHQLREAFILNTHI